MTEWEVIFSVTFVAIVAAVLALRAGIWTSKVDSDRRQFREFMSAMRNEFREFRVETRDEFREFRGDMRSELRGPLGEIRDGIRADREISRKIGRDVEEIKTLLERLPSAAVSNCNPLHLTDDGERSQTRYRA